MSVFIKGMDMPQDKGVIITIYPDGQVDKMADFFGGKTEQFSAVEITTPHGRLVDADAMTKEIERWKDHPNKYIRNRNKDFIFYLNDAETVIESEE